MTKPIQNAWRGKQNFSLAPLPPDLPPTYLLPMISEIDPSVGEELILVARDEFDAFSGLGSSVVGLERGSAFFKTPHGPVGVEVWGVTRDGPLVWVFERFFHEAILDHEDIWLHMDLQSHIHLFLCGPTDQVIGAFEYEVIHSGAEILQERRSLLEGMPCSDFALAKEHVYQLIPTPELVRLCLKMELPSS